ncbi:MAG: GNAT family N-acetyltransferase [Pirellulales bacterium]
MTGALDIHAASPDELIAAHRNVFDIWSKGLSLEEHVRYRLNSPKHHLAAWYVACVDGRVVVSLGAYPLRFRIRGEEVPGIAIGSVYTLAEFRRRGFARQLLAWVEHQSRKKGAAISLLYSDIRPDYYANMGYILCPSFEGWRDPRGISPPDVMTHRLVEIPAASHLDELANLYSCYHGAAPLSIARDAPYWNALLQRFEDDRFFALTDERGQWKGYVRLGRKDSSWRITDYALADQSSALAEKLYAATISLAVENGAQRVGGWLPEVPAAREVFELAPRQTEITMIKSLSPEHPFDDEQVASTSRFCEIDHV